MHLLGIVLLGLLIGSLGLLNNLGIQRDGYSNINKAAKNPDFVCREIPKKQPRDIELGHYAKTNDLTACPKDNHVHAGLLPDQTKKVLSHAQDDSNNVGATTNMTSSARASTTAPCRCRSRGSTCRPRPSPVSRDAIASWGSFHCCPTIGPGLLPCRSWGASPDSRPLGQLPDGQGRRDRGR